jgi:hypothetical protein
MENQSAVATALRQIAKGFLALADAVDPTDGVSTDDRYRAVLEAWGDRGLTREQASRLFRQHGFAPQASGGWVRGDWIEVRDDGLRYATERSKRWLDEEGTTP